MFHQIISGTCLLELRGGQPGAFAEELPEEGLEFWHKPEEQIRRVFDNN